MRGVVLRNMPRKPRNRTDDPKRRGSVGSSQRESATDAGGVSGAAPIAERRPTKPVSARNSLPEAQKRARNVGEKQQSARNEPRMRTVVTKGGAFVRPRAASAGVPKFAGRETAPLKNRTRDSQAMGESKTTGEETQPCRAHHRCPHAGST
jgi:hypothetical protein